LDALLRPAIIGDDRGLVARPRHAIEFVVER
jgi:hypothetical protein